MEDVISPKSSQAHLLHALDYFRQAELANGRLAEFQKERSRKAIEAKLKAGQVRRSKSLENLSAMDKFRKATEKIKIVNTIRHPGLAAGMGRLNSGRPTTCKRACLRSDPSRRNCEALAEGRIGAATPARGTPSARRCAASGAKRQSGLQSCNLDEQG